MKILYFFIFLWVIFAPLDPDSDPATQINADPQPCFSAPSEAPFFRVKWLYNYGLWCRRGRDGAGGQALRSLEGAEVTARDARTGRQVKTWPNIAALRSRLARPWWSLELTTAEQCCGSMTFWCGSESGSVDPCFWLMDPDPDPDADPDPSIFIIDLQDANKK